MSTPTPAQPEIHNSVTDTLGRTWTIVTELAVVGYRWTIYIHRQPYSPGALDMFHPGGVANGWTEMERAADAILALLAAWMKLFDAEPAGGEAPR